PDFDRLVLAAADYPVAVRTEGNAEDASTVSLECERCLAGRRIPDLDSLVCAGADNPPAVRTEGNAANEFAVSLDAESFHARRRIPYLDRIVITVRDLELILPTSSDNSVAVRAKGHTRKQTIVLSKRERFLAGDSVPKNRVFGIAADDSMAVRAKGDSI